MPGQSGPEPAISELWRGYLASKHGQFSANAGAPSTLWLASEQARWPMYDLAGFYVPDGAVPKVISMRPTRSDDGSAYEIVTRFDEKSSSNTSATPASVLTMTVYAVKQQERWVLANALPRKTAAWRREKVGQITYFISPALTFNAIKAKRAVSFIDSLASAFGLPRLESLDYYVASSVDEALEIIGVQYPVKYGPNGGFAKPVNQQLFSGIPAIGEDYRHELTHLVLRPLYQGGAVPYLGSEGVATWLGGTGGADFPAAVQGLVSYLDANPTITLDSIIGSASVSQSARYTGVAVLCAMLSTTGGTAAVREFVLANPAEQSIRMTLTRLLQRPWEAISADWRATAKRLASAATVRPGEWRSASWR